MKKLFFISFLMMSAAIGNAQVLNPVLWSFSSKKIADKTYEVHLTATIQKGWHMYSQHQPADASETIDCDLGSHLFLAPM